MDRGRLAAVDEIIELRELGVGQRQPRTAAPRLQEAAGRRDEMTADRLVIDQRRRSQPLAIDSGVYDAVQPERAGATNVSVEGASARIRTGQHLRRG